MKRYLSLTLAALCGCYLPHSNESSDCSILGIFSQFATTLGIGDSLTELHTDADNCCLEDVCNNATLNLDLGHDGGSYCLPMASCLKLTLPANHSTGYNWGIVNIDSSLLEEIGNEYELIGCPVPRVGCDGNEIRTFAPRLPGTSILRLEYRRWWSTEEPLYAFQATIITQVEND